MYQYENCIFGMFHITQLCLTKIFRYIPMYIPHYVDTLLFMDTLAIFSLHISTVLFITHQFKSEGIFGLVKNKSHL